jgi:hypothetical protein
MGLVVIPIKYVTELSQLRWVGHVVKSVDETYSKMAWRARTQGKRPKGRHRETSAEGVQKCLKEGIIEWDGVRAMARDCERWKALCKPYTPTGIRSSTEWSEVGAQICIKVFLRFCNSKLELLHQLAATQQRSRTIHIPFFVLVAYIMHMIVRS